MENPGHPCNGPIAQLDKLANLATVTLFSDTDEMTGSIDSGLDCRSHVGDIVLGRKCAPYPPPGYCNASFKALPPSAEGICIHLCQHIYRKVFGENFHMCKAAF